MRKLFTIAAYLLFLSLIPCGRTNAGWIEEKEPLMRGVGWNFPAIYGDKVIFDTGGGAGSSVHETGTYLYNITSGRLTFLTKELFGRKAFNGNSFVFQMGGNIYLFDLTRSRYSKIGSGKSLPDMDSDRVVYESAGEVVLYDLKNKKEKRVKPLGKMVAADEIGPSVSGDTVVWIERNGDGKGVIFSYSLRKQKDDIKKLKELPSGMLVNIQIFRLRNNILLLSNQSDVYIYDLNTGTMKRVSKPGSKLFAAGINDGLVFWDPDGGSTINIYDIAKDKYTSLVSKDASVYSVSAFKDKIFFVDYNRYELRKFTYQPE